MGCASYHLPGPSSLVSWVCSGSTVSGMPCVSSGELISDRDPPGRCQLSRIPGRLVSNWEPAHSSVEDAVFGVEIAPCLPALAATRLPLCLRLGKGPVLNRLALLWYSLSLCSVTWPGCALWLFTGNLSLSFFFLPPLWLSQSLDCYLTLAPSDCPQGLQAWSLP